MWPAVLFLGAIAGAQELPPRGDEDGPPQPAAAFPELTIAAKVTSEAHGAHTLWTVSAEGVTQYPTETRLVLEMQLKGNSGYIDQKYQVWVRNGRWDGKITVGNAVYKGRYVVRVSYDPIHQDRIIPNRIPAHLNRGNHQALTEVTIGTPEEIAADSAAAMQFYARSWAKTRDLIDRLEAEYAKQRKEPVRASWQAFADRFSHDLTAADREREVFRTLRMNVAEPDVQSKLAFVYATVSNYLVAQMETAIGFGAKADAAAARQVDQGLQGVRASMEWLGERLRDVKLDPNWTMPARPEVVRAAQPLPPGLAEPAGIVSPAAPIGPQGPVRTRLADGPKIGLVEGGIGFAALCGIAILVVLLRRK